MSFRHFYMDRMFQTTAETKGGDLDHMFWKELFLRLSVRVFRECLSIYRCPSSSMVLRVGCGISLY